MVYVHTFVSTYACNNGHTFDRPTEPLLADAPVPCPLCYADWIKENIPHAVRISKPRKKEPEVTYD